MILKLKRIGGYVPRVVLSNNNLKIILTYKGRGYKNRLGRIGRSRTIIQNLEITKHVKRNRVYRLVYNALNKKQIL
jgi:hypothetical protein